MKVSIITVIASNKMSVPEIVGDAGLIIDPEDIDSMAQAIKKMILNHKLRQKFIARGYERTKDFSWSDAADKILKIANRIA